jgi:hypothetical protein
MTTTAHHSRRSRPVTLARAPLAVLAGCVARAWACHSPSAPSGPAPTDFVLPVRTAQVDGPAGSKVVPYGMPLDEHPTGHPGIDFFLEQSLPVRRLPLDPRLDRGRDEDPWSRKSATSL